MNERIKELVEQAGIWKPTHDHKTWVRGEYVASPGELEKFAELMMQECISVIQNIKPQYGDYRDQIETAQSVYCIDQIKRHFGVEQ